MTADFCCGCEGVPTWRLVCLQAVSSNALALLNCYQADPVGCTAELAAEPAAVAADLATALYAELMAFDMAAPPAAYGDKFDGWNPALVPPGTEPDYRMAARWPDINPATGLYEYAWHSMKPGDPAGINVGGTRAGLIPNINGGSPYATVQYGVAAGVPTHTGYASFWIVNVSRMTAGGYTRLCESRRSSDGVSTSVTSCGLVNLTGTKDYNTGTLPPNSRTSFQVANLSGRPYTAYIPWIVDGAHFSYPGKPATDYCADCVCSA